MADGPRDEPLPLGAEASTGFTTRSQEQPLAHLLLRLQDGDHSAFEPLIVQTQASAFRLANSILSDRHLAEDVLQEVYLTVYREIRTLRNPAAFRGWFLRILTNRCRRAQRGQKPAEIDPDHPGESSADWKVDLRMVLAGIPATDRTVLALREIFQCSYQEIAQVLKVPLGTVKSRLSEARRRLLQAWTR